MWTKKAITDHLGIVTKDKGVIIYYLIDEHNMLSVPIEKAELPALLRELEKAAEGMGVEMVQAELVVACKDLLWAMNGWGEGEPPAAIIANATEVLRRVSE